MLKDTFKGYFYLGTALNSDQIFGKDLRSLHILKQHFNSITAENEMKWSNIQEKQGEFNFQSADRFVALGEENNMFIIGHALVWHDQTPDWVFQDKSGKLIKRETMLKYMRDHISTVVGRYKGRVHGWDVVNEAIDDNGQLRNSKWLKIIGEGYIQKAFEHAHEADPDAELYYNNTSLVKPVKRDGERGSNISRSFQFKKEYNPYPEVLPDSMQEKLANRCASFFKIFYKPRDKISRVTIWGIHDGQSWLNEWPIKGRTNYPLLFDREYKAKPAFYAVVKSIS